MRKYKQIMHDKFVFKLAILFFYYYNKIIKLIPLKRYFRTRDNKVGG